MRIVAAIEFDVRNLNMDELRRVIELSTVELRRREEVIRDGTVDKEELRTIIREQGIVQAIIRYRQLTGHGLRDSKETVESIRDEFESERCNCKGTGRRFSSVGGNVTWHDCVCRK